jgi:hypothetical protein
LRKKKKSQKKRKGGTGGGGLKVTEGTEKRQKRELKIKPLTEVDSLEGFKPDATKKKSHGKFSIES